IASEQLKLEPTTKTPLEINDADETKGIAYAKKILEDNKLEITDENIFITSTCGDKGVSFLKGEAKENIRKISAETPKKKVGKSETYTVNLEGETYVVSVNGDKATVNGTDFGFDIAEGGTPETQKETVGDNAKGKGHPIKAPMPGTIFKIIAQNGDKIEEGDTVLIMEAMKMETEIKATKSGIVKVSVSVGQQIQAGDDLAIIK
ncbi:MAG: biotin attachment protein, partial [Elusimicrobiaceae bacterium]|nr:biotin attachment protein [Elusimicrobiaceae bacterium]